jgi:septum formation protein
MNAVPGLMASDAPLLVLASASASRSAMLAAAGIGVERQPAAVDEVNLRNSLKAEGADAEEAAMALAELKASTISRKIPNALVIGADQILEADGQWFEKPHSREQARDELRALSGREHRLATAVCVQRDGTRLWGCAQSPRLKMRELTDDFLEAYLDHVGDAAFTSVGAYQLEGAGAQLFERIDGDFFTILGLPLLALLDFLRVQGALRP